MAAGWPKGCNAQNTKGNIIKRISDFDRKHPEGIDDHYHLLDTSAVGRVLYWQQFFGLVRHVPGTIVECGIGRGRSLVVIAALNTLYGADEGGQRDIWGFDSFEGFDEPDPQDDSARKPKKGDWSRSPSGQYAYSPEFIREVLEEARVDSARVKLVKGFLENSLPGYSGGPIALLNIDCDLYKPYKNVLELLYGQVMPGGLIVFDDFKIEENPRENFPGARKAVYEFFGERIRNFQKSLKGNPYYIKPK